MVMGDRPDMQRTEVPLLHAAPPSTFMQAFYSLESAEKKEKDREKQVIDEKASTTKYTKRVRTLEKIRKSATEARKKAESRFITKLSEAVGLFRDFNADKGVNEDIQNTIKEFFRKIKESGRTQALFMLLVKDENPFCLDHVFRCGVVPEFLEGVLPSSKFFGGLKKKAIETRGRIEDAAGGVLAIKMFGLNEEAKHNLVARAKEPFVHQAMMWLMSKTPEESGERYIDDSMIDDLTALQKRAGLDEVTKSVLDRREYELDEADKCKLAAAVQKQMKKIPVHWFVAYFLFKLENGGTELVGRVPLTEFEKKGANALYSMFSLYTVRAEREPDENEGGGIDLYSAAPPENISAGFRF